MADYRRAAPLDERAEFFSDERSGYMNRKQAWSARIAQ
jgi:hypothetical protein